MIRDADQNFKDQGTWPNSRCIMSENFRKIGAAVSEELHDTQMSRKKIIIRKKTKIPMKKQTGQKQ
mgnify:CR=1 FL=1